ncbi:hypothetical protein ANN_26277 [Periplaneta americana]|uniref:DUF659 domain-containing protein n=1 Tax=Periplaneta americana TaxID=6978 RepID=A0ABQ8S5X0_PERAM|nr:hypothetical protein ANN_26277 [Periplaneta americana]
MVKAGNSLRALYWKMVHLTCLAHACHRVEEEVKSQVLMVDQLIGNVKKVFVDTPSKVASFKAMTPGSTNVTCTYPHEVGKLD